MNRIVILQYTLRNISKATDRALRAKAKSEGKRLNQALLEAVERGLGLNGKVREYNDLDWFLGSGGLEDSVMKAIAENDVVHPDDWK
jgi:hypothetical protein